LSVLALVADLRRAARVLERHQRLDARRLRAGHVVGHARELVVAARHHVVGDDDPHLLHPERGEERVAEHVRLVLADADMERGEEEEQLHEGGRIATGKTVVAAALSSSRSNRPWSFDQDRR
jgi:hypothetical protein